MKKAFAPKSNSSRRSVRRHRFSHLLVVAISLAALLAVPLISKWTRTVHAAGDVSLTTIGTAVTQNFDTLANSPVDSTPTWTDGTTLTGWYSQFTAVTTNPTTYRVGAGASNAGALYSYGVAGTNVVTERALGSLASGGTGDDYFAVKLTNNTGSTINGLLISFNGEQWRQGGCTPTPCTPASQKLDFQYQVANAGVITDANTPTSGWSDFDTLDFTTPQPGTSTAAAIDGNAVANRTAKSAMLATGNVANGQEIWLRWKDSNDANNDHGLAIDDFSVTPFSPIGTNGYRTTDIQGTDDGGYAMVIQPDNKIVVGGYAVSGSQKDFALVRYNSDGSLDTTFNGTGKVTTDISGASRSDRIWGLALQSDGKIVAAGEVVAVGGDNDIALARYNSNGTLDTTGFGVGGIVTTDHGVPLTNNSAYGVALQGTNIIVAGVEKVGTVNNFMAARYTSAGLLDATFGTLGVTTVGFSGGNDVARAVAIDSSSRVVLGGYSSNGSNDDFAVARLTSTGTLDPTFVGGAGKAAIDLGNNNADQAFAVGIDGAGRIILAGSTYNGVNKDFAFACYLSTGALDTAGFGGGTGIKKTDFGNSPDVAQSILVRTDGSFVAGGFSRYSDSSDDFAIASYNSSGGPDTTFNGTGRLTFRISNYDERIYAIAQGLDSKLVVAGFATQTPITNPVKHDFAVARFNLNGTVDSTNPTILNVPDLLTTKVGPTNPNTVIAGQQFTYTISVENRGGAAATNVVVTDPIPAGVTFVSATNGATFSSGTVTKTVGTMVPGATVSFQITVTAGPPRTVANTATATLTETDATPANNAATEYTHIIGPDLFLTMQAPANPNTVIAGQQFTYTITVGNGGDADATNVVITDPLPSGVTFVSATNGAVNNNGTVTKTVGTMNPGAQISFQITVAAGNVLNVVTNTATATLTEPDPSPPNNSDTRATRIIGIVDLSFSPSTVIGGCQNSTGTVTLSGVAPAGGATVTLTSADPATASAPAQVIVPQGQSAAQFTATTSIPNTNKQVRFQADLGPTSFVRRLVVNTGCN